jgi:hypothetical protein
MRQVGERYLGMWPVRCLCGSHPGTDCKLRMAAVRLQVTDGCCQPEDNSHLDDWLNCYGVGFNGNGRATQVGLDIIMTIDWTVTEWGSMAMEELLKWGLTSSWRLIELLRSGFNGNWRATQKGLDVIMSSPLWVALQFPWERHLQGLVRRHCGDAVIVMATAMIIRIKSVRFRSY